MKNTHKLLDPLYNWHVKNFSNFTLALNIVHLQALYFYINHYKDIYHETITKINNSAEATYFLNFQTHIDTLFPQAHLLQDSNQHFILTNQTHHTLLNKIFLDNASAPSDQLTLAEFLSEQKDHPLIIKLNSIKHSLYHTFFETLTQPISGPNNKHIRSSDPIIYTLESMWRGRKADQFSFAVSIHQNDPFILNFNRSFLLECILSDKTKYLNLDNINQILDYRLDTKLSKVITLFDFPLQYSFLKMHDIGFKSIFSLYLDQKVNHFFHTLYPSFTASDLSPYTKKINFQIFDEHRTSGDLSYIPSQEKFTFYVIRFMANNKKFQALPNPEKEQFFLDFLTLLHSNNIIHLESVQNNQNSFVGASIDSWGKQIQSIEQLNQLQNSINNKTPVKSKTFGL